MKGFPVRPVPVENVGEVARAVARRQAEQLTLVRRRAQPTAVYIARLTVTAVFAYLLALQLPGGSSRDVVAPLTALLVAQATLFHTIGTAIRRVAAVTAGVLAAVAVAAYVPFSWWVLGLLIAGTMTLGIVLRLREEILEVPISAMLIFSTNSHTAATSRITETLVGAAAGLAAGLLFAPLRVQPAKEAVGELSRQMADLLGQMAEGLAEAPDPRRAAEWLDRTRALRGEIERVDDALAQAEESIRLNPRRLRFGDPAAALREGVDTLERAATDIRVLARSVADSARIDSEHTPVKEAETRARLAAVIAELSAAVRAYGQLLEADPVAPGYAEFAPEPLTEQLEDHLEEAQRQQDQLADLLSTDPAERPEGWQLRGEILAHVDRLRSELEPDRLPEPAQVKPLLGLRDRHRSERHQPERHQPERHQPERHQEPATGPRRRPNRTALRVRAKRAATRGNARRGGLRLAVVDGLDVVAVRIAQEHTVVTGVVLRELARGVAWHTTRVTALKLPGLPFALEPAGGPPPRCLVRHGVLTLTAAAGTDLFVDPGGAERVPDAGRLVGLPPAGDFTLAAQVSVEFASMYDAGVLLLHAAERHWAKLCFEYSPQLTPTAVTVVTRGTSDDCNSFEVEDGTRLWLRITRSGPAWAFHASTDGTWWRLLRYFALPGGMVRVGFLAQSPAGPGCAATFDHITFRPGAPENLRDGS